MIGDFSVPSTIIVNVICNPGHSDACFDQMKALFSQGRMRVAGVGLTVLSKLKDFIGEF